MNDEEAAFVTQIAITCHEVNRIFCEFNDDFSQPNFINAPDWQIESAINGVIFHIENPDANDSASHDNWMKQKIADGWVYGEEKDVDKKTHPCIVPFEELPKHQQFKDRLFRTVVHSFL